jgi:hypothetical protein
MQSTWLILTYMLTICENTNYDVRRDLVPHEKCPLPTPQHLMYSHFKGPTAQPEDGPPTGPKHVLLKYICSSTILKYVVLLTVLYITDIYYNTFVLLT